MKITKPKQVESEFFRLFTNMPDEWSIGKVHGKLVVRDDCGRLRYSKSSLPSCTGYQLERFVCDCVATMSPHWRKIADLLLEQKQLQKEMRQVEVKLGSLGRQKLQDSDPEDILEEFIVDEDEESDG